MDGMAQVFSRKTLAFLRALTRNNDREWFRQRKPAYEEHVRGPMIGLLERLAGDLPRFAPELISEPRASLYRIYRDTRFSEDKTPLKTHVAAHFPARGFPRGEGSGLYLEVAPSWVWIGGGLYMPASADLRLIRAHIADHHRALHRIVSGAAFKRAVGALEQIVDPAHARARQVADGATLDEPDADIGMRCSNEAAQRDWLNRHFV